jgi:glycosyltransferase involved in cell wall biosynthesis
MTPVKVAIVQNQVGIDGRSRVIGEIVVALNELGVTPDVYTLSTVRRRRSWLRVLMQGRQLRCEFAAQTRLPILRGYAYQTVLHNWLLRNALRGYDLIVNSNDFVGFLPRGVRRLHYFHFPLRASFAVMPRYRQRAVRAMASLARWMAARFDGDVQPGDVVLANSRFTRERVRHLWPDASVDVLYPPVDVPATIPDGQRDIDVVTLGNIAPDKHQLEQVEIAAMMPERRFAILGAVQSRSYARQVERAIRTKRLTNVVLVLDETARRVSDYLGRARVFLHMKESEHFGISVGQAIAHGCIPIVHDSGGQVELVTDPSLRFRSRADLLQILPDALGGRIPDPGYVHELRARVRDLAPECFRSRIKDVLS